MLVNYALSLRPVDSNILFKIPGEGIYLYDPLRNRGGKAKKTARLEKYFYPGMNRKKIMNLLSDRLVHW